MRTSFVRENPGHDMKGTASMIFKKLLGVRPIPGSSIGVAEAQAKVEAGDALLVDVREPNEWHAGHIAGATHIPLGTIVARASALPKDREILVICRTGNRSAMAQERLAQAGVTNVTNVEGGVTAWVEHGFPVATGEESVR